MMYILGVLCFVSFTAALPFSEPHVEDVAPNDPALDTTASALEIDAQKGEHEEKKDEDKADALTEFTMTAPDLIKPPRHEVIIELHKVDKYSESEDPIDKIIPRQLGISGFVNTFSSALSNFFTYGLPAFLSIAEKIPLFGSLFGRSVPSRVVIIDEVQ